ncbi:hypothetical protein ACFQPG_00930 [Sphingomonas sp. GCM10030256]|uniref:hypothetical protein n=1 Tax=Sphingomonas sp. GCM10030256 TaxID=3273427 RepID=UPI00361506E7
MMRRLVFPIAFSMLASCASLPDVPTPSSAQAKESTDCAAFGGNTHCFVVAQIEGGGIPSVSPGAVSLLMPLEEASFGDCNARSSGLDEYTPYLHARLFVDEPDPSETAEKRWHRLIDLVALGPTSSLIRPAQSYRWVQLDCLRYHPDQTNDEGVCTDGGGPAGQPSHLLTCSRVESVPLPHCDDVFRLGDLQLKLSYQRECARHHVELRRMAVAYVSAARQRGIALTSGRQ